MTVTIRPSIDRPTMFVVVCSHCGVLHAYPLDRDDAVARHAGHVAVHGLDQADEVAA